MTQCWSIHDSVDTMKVRIRDIYSLSKTLCSPWALFPPTKVKDLIKEH